LDEEVIKSIERYERGEEEKYQGRRMD